MKFKYLYRPTILKYLLTLYCLNLFLGKKKKRKHWVNSMKVTRVQNTPNCRLTSFPKAQIDVPGREKTACTEVHRGKRVWQKPDCK